MTIKRFIFIRPGETGWNRLGRWQGHVAVPLSDHGKLQAERLAKFVRVIGIQQLYTSDLRRALETAQIIAGVLNLTPIPDARLRERHIGMWQGLTQAEVEAWYPNEYRQLVENPNDYQIPDGEARQHVTERMLAAFKDILAQTSDKAVGIVSHTTAIRALLGSLMPDINPYALDFANMSVTSIARDTNGKWSFTQQNDVSHLEGMPSEAFRELEKEKP